MSWQNILTLAIVLGIAVFFVWRSSGTKGHNHKCGCGCAHEPDAKIPEDKAAS